MATLKMRDVAPGEIIDTLFETVTVRAEVLTEIAQKYKAQGYTVSTVTAPITQLQIDIIRNPKPAKKGGRK